MAEHQIKVDVIEREGGYPFDDYAQDCSAGHAFAFLLQPQVRAGQNKRAGTGGCYSLPFR